MDLQGIPTSGSVGPAHAPVGAGIIRIGDGAQPRVVEADPQTAFPSEVHHGLSGEQVPVQFIADARRHWLCPQQVHRFTAGSRSRNALGIGMARQDQNVGVRWHRAGSQPVLTSAQTTARAGEGIGIRPFRCPGSGGVAQTDAQNSQNRQPASLGSHGGQIGELSRLESLNRPSWGPSSCSRAISSSR